MISGAAEDSSLLYKRMNQMIPKLTLAIESENPDEVIDGDYTLDEKNRQVELTESGHQKIESMLAKDGLLDANDSLYSAANLGLLHHVHAALKAYTLFQKDIDYIVQDRQVVLID